MKTSLVSAAVLPAALQGSPARSGHAAPAPDPVKVWNDLALDSVRMARSSDAQSARLYAMLNAAIFDAVNGILSREHHADREHAIVPVDAAPRHADSSAAASAAAHAVLVGAFPQFTQRFDQRLQADLAALGHAARVDAGREWGAEVGAGVLEARENDGSSPDETQPAGSGPGQFRADWSGVQFRNLVPFGVADSSAYVGSGPPGLESLDYAGGFAEVALIGYAAIPDAGKLATYQFWNLGTGTSQPPGAWIQIALIVGGARNLALPEKARLLTLVSLALVDTVPSTVMTKFTYRHWRPATAIREADTDGNPLTDADPGWAPRAGGIGTSPEYWSGPRAAKSARCSPSSKSAAEARDAASTRSPAWHTGASTGRQRGSSRVGSGQPTRLSSRANRGSA